MSSLEYQNSLPKKRMGSGALFFSESNELLLVEPSYKPTWEIPGGVVEAHESPRVCCEREVLEELGLHIKIGRLLCLDYNATTETRLESLMFIFDGGVLSESQIRSIQLQDSELLSYRFFSYDALPDNLSATLKQRVQAGWRRRDGIGEFDAYLEEGL